MPRSPLTVDEAQTEILRRLANPGADPRAPLGDLAGTSQAQSDYLANLAMAMPDLIRTFRPTHLLKIRRGLSIADEVGSKWRRIAEARGRSVGHGVGTEDNDVDAQRHAEWITRMAKELGPDFAEFVGLLHETITPNLPYARKMDMRNNADVLDAYRRGAPYTVDDLQTNPYAPPRKVSGVAGSYLQRHARSHR